MSKNIINEIALKLNWNLHSSASENILSSLFAASLNESEDFRKWFCGEVFQGHRNNKYLQYYAQANDTLPKVMRSSKANSPVHPDVLVWHLTEEDKWGKADNNNQQVAVKAAKDIRAIFIEVKHLDLPGKDANKYIKFLDRLAVISGNKHKISDNHKFVIISSHRKSVKNRLNGTWKKLQNDGRVKHITLQEILEKINKNKNWCGKCTILQLFEEYLNLVLWTNPQRIHNNYWDYYIKYYKTTNTKTEAAYRLKREIIYDIKWLSEMAGIHVKRKPNLDKKIKQIDTIKFDNAGNEYKLEFIDSSKYTRILNVECSIKWKKPRIVDLKHIVDNNDPREIMKVMKDILKIL